MNTISAKVRTLRPRADSLPSESMASRSFKFVIPRKEKNRERERKRDRD